MKVINKGILKKAVETHSGLKKPLETWLSVMSACQARSPIDLKQTWNSVDTVPPQTFFDIKGNQFRLITTINYQFQTVTVQFVLTHAEYSKNKWKES